MVRGIAIVLVTLASCGGAPPPDPEPAREPVFAEPLPIVPAEPPPAPAPPPQPASGPIQTPCQVSCSTMVGCHEGGFAGLEACETACTAATRQVAWACRSRASTCGAARLCVAPDALRGGRYSARALTAPVAVAAEWRRKGETAAGDTVRYALVLRLTDARQTVRDVAVAAVSMPDVGAVVSIEAVLGDEGPLFSDERFYAGVGDNFRVTHAGDRLVVEHQETDEQVGAGRWRPTARVDLPRRAAVTTATLPL